MRDHTKFLVEEKFNVTNLTHQFLALKISRPNFENSNSLLFITAIQKINVSSSHTSVRV